MKFNQDDDKKFIPFLAQIIKKLKDFLLSLKFLLYVLGYISGSALVLLFWYLIPLLSYSPAEALHESLRDDYVLTAETQKDTPKEPGTAEDDRWAEAIWSMEKDADDALWYGDINVDFEGLWELNKDIVGWIYFEAAEISYPVLYSGNDETYLRTTYDGKYQTAGSIFLEGQNSSDFSDKHIIIYGHNMRDKTMFGQLRLYKTNKSYYKNHQYFQLIYKDKETNELKKDRYHIFACKDVEETDDIYQLFEKDYADMGHFANSIIRPGNYLSGASDIIIRGSDQIVTLSTCSAGDNRFVVCGVKCGECIVK